MSNEVYIALGIFYGIVIAFMLGGAFLFFNKSFQEKKARYIKQWKRRHLKIVRNDDDDRKRK